MALPGFKCSGLWGWVEIKENRLCKSVTPAIMARQRKCTHWPSPFEVGMELPLEICKMLVTFGSGRQSSGRGALLPPGCYAFSNSAIKVVSHDIA